ncbi:hypothetical protein FRC09_011639 [Ceratobasidium sp. 395]|nr:hypothetical protein FRC09_011639 [Ceratobasidium sp. 395]
MPAQYNRRRRAQPVSTARSPMRPLSVNTEPIVLTDSSSTDQKLIDDIIRASTLVPGTPNRKGILSVEPLGLVSYSPARHNLPTVYHTPTGDATLTDSGPGTPNSEHAPEETQNGEDQTPVKKEPVNPPDNLLGVPSPSLIREATLRESLRSTRGTAALRQADSDPRILITTHMGRTGAPIVDRAVDDLRCSRYGLWMGNSYEILKNCSWVNNPERSSMATLQWRPNASSKLPHDEGDAVISFLGTVTVDGLNMGPDANYQLTWGTNKLYKAKRSLRAGYPGPSSNVPLSFWKTQFGGAAQLVENACKTSNDKQYEVSHSFVNKLEGFLRVRSPVFLPAGQSVQDPGDRDDTESGPASEAGSECIDVSKDYDFSTWNIDSPGVRDAFERLIEQGYEPQVVEAYTQSDRLIHPNNLTSTIAGAIVLVHCTLERMRFSKDNGAKAEFQFYANLVKVQILKSAAPAKPISNKRKHVHSYGPNDNYGPDGRSSDGAVSKRRKLISA